MTTRPTTLVESDQLAQAAANVIRNEDLVPKGKRWPFLRISKAQRDYEKAVLEITTRRREARENAVEQKIKKERAEADSIFDRAKNTAETAHNDSLAEAKRPYNETEAQARSERDAAIAAANLTYQQAIDKANAVFMQEAVVIDEQHNAVIGEISAVHDAAYAAVDAKRKADMAQIAKDMKTIPLEGPMRIVEDKQAWSLDDRQKALIGIVYMAGREDFNAEYTELCLQNVAGYVFQDRYLKPEAQHHRLMDANLLEALVDLARRNPEKRPMIVKHMHSIVVQNPGHSSPAFIKNLTELYVVASADAETNYHSDPIENEKTFELMREHIADTLKLTPRRSLVPAPGASPVVAREPTTATVTADGEGEKTPVMMRRSDADITADVDVRDLIPIESADTQRAAPDSGSSELPDLQQPSAATKTPPVPQAPPAKRGKRAPVPEGTP